MTFVTRELSEVLSAGDAEVVAAVPGSSSDAVQQPRSLKLSTNSSIYRAALKRVLDVALVLFALPVWFPVIALFATLTALDGHNPFYRQKRIGRNGRVFNIWKLRSMVIDADDRLATCLAADPQARAEWEKTQKLKNDPRVTPIGRILRKTSLDELPQLINVLTGDMSLVGPRPMMLCQRELYHGDTYYDMRPGLTGLWQVSARNNSAFSDRVRFDDFYAARMSFQMDMTVLMRTIGVVLRGTGY